MRKTLLLSLFVLLTASLRAQDNDAELVNHETHITIKNGKLTKTILFEIKINNRAGEKYTNITIPYSKIIKVSNIDAYIKDVNGNIIKKISKKDIKYRSAISDFSFYEDEFEKVFTLKHNFYPYIVVYSYQVIQDEFLYIEHWHPVIDFDVPTLKASLRLEVPPGYNISIKTQHTDCYQKDSTEQSIIHKWSASYTNKLDPEVFSPSIDLFFPSVIIVPESFKFELPGSFKSWLAYGDWQYQLNKGLMDLPNYEKARINSSVKDLDNDRDRIKKLYNNLQNDTRYVNVTIETGGMKPYPASYVASNKYGDCKALTNYFKAVLNQVGIPSFYTKVYAGDVVREPDQTFPSQQFNHIILCIPNRSDSIWLDCTSKLPFGYLGTFIQNRDVFLVDQNNSHFVRTPALSIKDVLETRTVRITYNQQNEVVAEFINTYKGDKFESIYYITNYLSEQRKQQTISRDFIEPGFDAIYINPIETWHDSTIVRLSYTAKSSKIYNNYGKETLIKIIPFVLPTMNNPKNRNLPVQIDFPIYKSDTLEYSIPKGKIIAKQLTNHQIESSFGKYLIEFNQINNKVTVLKSFILYSENYSTEEYQGLYNFINQVRDYESNAYIITQTPN